MECIRTMWFTAKFRMFARYVRIAKRLVFYLACHCFNMSQVMNVPGLVLPIRDRAEVRSLQIFQGVDQFVCIIYRFSVSFLFSTK